MRFVPLVAVQGQLPSLSLVSLVGRQSRVLQAMATLASLLEQSQRLQTSLASSSAQPGVDLPAIQLGLDQIESQSRRIAGRSLKEAGQTGNA